MQVKVTGRHASITEAMKAYAEEKAQKLLRFFNRISEIHVILDYEGGMPTAEFLVDAEHSDDFVGKETNEDMYAAIDRVVDKLENQLRRHKERLREHHKGGEKGGEAAQQ